MHSRAEHRSWDFTILGHIPTSSITLVLGALPRREMLLLSHFQLLSIPWLRGGDVPGLHNPGQMGRKWLEGSWTVPIVPFRLGAFAPLLLLCHTAELCACLPSRNEGGDWLEQGSLETVREEL